MRVATPRGETRESILDAAERLLGRFGYRKTTMEDVAREAGIGKGTIYLYFPSKEELALSSLDRLIDGLRAELRGILESGGAPEKRLRLMLVTRVMHRFDNIRQDWHSMDAMLSTIRAPFLARREKYFAAEAEILAAVVEEGRRAQAFEIDDPAAAARSLITATNALLPYSLTPRELTRRAALERRTEHLVELLLRALRPTGGASARRSHPQGGVS